MVLDLADHAARPGHPRGRVRRSSMARSRDVIGGAGRRTSRPGAPEPRTTRSRRARAALVRRSMAWSPRTFTGLLGCSSPSWNRVGEALHVEPAATEATTPGRGWKARLHCSTRTSCSSYLCFMQEKAAVGADLYIEDSPGNVERLRAEQFDIIVFTNSTSATASRYLDSGHRACSRSEDARGEPAWH